MKLVIIYEEYFMSLYMYTCTQVTFLIHIYL